MQQRFEQAREWSKHPPVRVPTMWLAGLCRPRVCIGAILLLLACPNQIPIDRAALEVVGAEAEDDTPVPPGRKVKGGTDRLTVRGLHLCGASWDP
eukprot:2953664-Rhodomonas_salina.1